MIERKRMESYTSNSCSDAPMLTLWPEEENTFYFSNGVFFFSFVAWKKGKVIEFLSIQPVSVDDCAKNAPV